jgi:hypothetical protein
MNVRPTNIQLREFYDLGKRDGKIMHLLLGAFLGFAFAFSIYLIIIYLT